MARQGAITTEQQEFLEEWENVSPSEIWVIKLSPRGDEQHEMAPAGRKFQVTTEERLIHQAKVADPKNDPYQNGTFRPITVPDEVNVETNPNALSVEDIKRIFQASDVAWNEYMEVIDSPATLHRMMQLAEDSDISLSRFRDLEAKFRKANPRRRVTQKDREQYEGLANTPKAPTGSERRTATSHSGGARSEATM